MNDNDNASDYKSSYLLFTLAFETNLPTDETCLTLRSFRKEEVLDSHCSKYKHYCLLEVALCASLDKNQHKILNKLAEAACWAEIFAPIYEIMNHSHKKIILRYKDILIESKLIFTLLNMLVYFILQQYVSSLIWSICIASTAKSSISGKCRERKLKRKHN